MRVCLVIEGAYPYVYGGVSSWAHSYIQDMKDVDFVLWIIGAEEKDKDNFKYKLPANVVEVHQIFLDNAVKELHRPYTFETEFTEKEIREIKEFLSCNRPDWKVIFSLFQKKNVKSVIFFPAKFLCRRLNQSAKYIKIIPMLTPSIIPGLCFCLYSIF